jgi:hypothetical protein
MRGLSLLLSLMLVVWGQLEATAPAPAEGGVAPRKLARSPEPASLKPLIVVEGDLLSVRLFNTSLSAVVTELERHAGITIRIKGSLTGTISNEFDRVPLEQGLRRLFRDSNLILVYGTPVGTSDARLIQVWLFPTHTSPLEVAPTGPADGVSPSEVTATHEEDDRHAGAETDHAERVARLHVSADQHDMGALHEALFAIDPTLKMTAFELLAERDPDAVTALVLSATRDRQPERRLQALSLLYETGGADEGTMLSVLSGALADEDSSVKGYAIRVLSERRWPGVLDQLRRLARDPDPATRMQVIESVVPDKDGMTLLRELLSDADESVSSAAASKVEQARETQ